MFRNPNASRMPQGILASSAPMMTSAQKAMAKNQPVKAQDGTSVDLTKNPALAMIAADTEMTNIDQVPFYNPPQPKTGAELLAANSMAGQIDITSPFRNAAQEQESLVSDFETAIGSSDKALVEETFKQVYGDRETAKTEEENVREGVDLMQKYLGDIDPRAKDKNIYMAVMRAGLEYASGKELGEAGLAALDQFSVGAKEIADEEKGLIRAGVQLGLDRTEAEKLRDQALKDSRFNAEFNYLLDERRADRDAKKTAFNARYGFLTSRLENEAEQIKFARTIASQETQLAAQLSQQLQIATDDRVSAEDRTNAQIEASRTNTILSNLDTGASIAFEAGWQKGLRGDALMEHVELNAPSISKALGSDYLKDYSPNRLKIMAIDAVVTLDAADPGVYIDPTTGEFTDAGQGVFDQYIPPTVAITEEMQTKLTNANLDVGDTFTGDDGKTYLITDDGLVAQ